MLFDDSKTSTDWFCWQHRQQETLPLGRSADRTNSSLTWRYVAGRCCASVWNNVHGETLASLDLLPSPAHIIDMLRSLHTAQSSITLLTHHRHFKMYTIRITDMLHSLLHPLSSVHNTHHRHVTLLTCSTCWYVTLSTHSTLCLFLYIYLTYHSLHSQK